jgi:hypothetical protein
MDVCQASLPDAHPVIHLRPASSWTSGASCSGTYP